MLSSSIFEFSRALRRRVSTNWAKQGSLRQKPAATPVLVTPKLHTQVTWPSLYLPQNHPFPFSGTRSSKASRNFIIKEEVFRFGNPSEPIPIDPD